MTAILLLGSLGTITGAEAATTGRSPGSPDTHSVNDRGAMAVPSVAQRHVTSTRSMIERSRSVHLVNIAPQPSFVSDCSTSSISPQCVGSELAAIDNARISEGLAPIHVSPANFAALSGPEQLLAITNLERLARGLPPVVALTAGLDAVAARGAIRSADPTLNGWTTTGKRPVLGWASNWAGGFNVLEAYYIWMYYDGVGYNIDCTSAVSPGCWGHRDNVLVTGPTSRSCSSNGGSPELLMGAAIKTTKYHGAPSIAEVLVQSCGGLPVDTTATWSAVHHALVVGAGE